LKKQEKEIPENAETIAIVGKGPVSRTRTSIRQNLGGGTVRRLAGHAPLRKPETTLGVDAALLQAVNERGSKKGRGKWLCQHGIFSEKRKGQEGRRA